MFTKLGSQSFDWTFTSVNLKDSRNILRFLWFKDSLYKTKSEVYDLEKKASEILYTKHPYLGGYLYWSYKLFGVSA